MVITEWPALILVRANTIRADHVIYGHYGMGDLILWDAPMVVTSVVPSVVTEGWLRINGHEADGIEGFTVHPPNGRLIIGKEGI
jgi:hypothetical protein